MSPRAAVLLEAFGFQDVADYSKGKADWLARGLPIERSEGDPITAGELAVQGPLLELRMSSSDCASLIDHHDGNVGVVVGDGGVVLGLLTREAASSSPDAVAEEIMEFGPSTFRADEDLQTVLDYMDRNDAEQVVISDPDGAIIGVLKRSDAKEFEDQ